MGLYTKLNISNCIDSWIRLFNILTALRVVLIQPFAVFNRLFCLRME